MRKSNAFLLWLAIGSLLLLFTVLDASMKQRKVISELSHQVSLVEELGLTDLSLFTEARYTRHLSQSDLHTAFQDHPFALEHFPSGSLLMPPERWLP